MKRTSLLSRSLVGSLLFASACTDQEDLNVAVDEARRAPSARTTECSGETFADPTFTATLAVDAAAGLATLSITNHSTETHQHDAVVVMRKSGGSSTSGLIVPAVQKVTVAAGETGVARFELSALGLDPSMPEQLVAEVTLRDAAGTVIERTFAHASAGPSVAETAARLRIQAPKGTTLGAISRGGPGAPIDSFRPTHDAIDEIATNPDLPLPTFNYDMCFRWPVTLVDAGFGEDYGIDPTSPWIARGGRVSIVQKGKTLFDGYLDSNGCTGAFKASGTQDFSIFGWSRAKVANNDIIARDAEGKQVTFVIWDADPGFDQTPVYVFPEVAPVTTMLAVAAFTVQKFNGGMTGKTIPLENRCNPVEGGCCDCSQDGGIWLTDFGADKKFAIAHELGHRILSLYTGGYNNDATFDLDANDMLACDTSSGHAMWSMEYDAGAAMEGWAHFMAAAAFNDRAGDNPAGMFRYWSSTNTIDLEQSSPSFPSNYLDTVCTIPLGITDKMGVELDWLRHWWDYYTNALDVDPGVRPTMTQMMAEIDAAPGWTRSSVWTAIRDGVSTYSGAEQADRWEQHGAWNGVD